MPPLLIGTSGYAYTEWAGPVYPASARPEDFLSLYAARFRTVELNFSYYRMPRAEQLERLREDAGPGFVFSIKAHGSLTHRVEAGSWRSEAVEFRRALEPLGNEGGLGAVLFQFPYSFHYEPERRRYLDALLSEFQGIPSAVEFRNQEWCNNRVLEALKKRTVALVSPDLPALPRLPPPMDVVTAPLAYVRLHGRREEAWWGSDSASRYDYLYSEDELKAWSERLWGVLGKADRVLVYFNNHPKGKAVQNAERLRAIMDEGRRP